MKAILRTRYPLTIKVLIALFKVAFMFSTFCCFFQSNAQNQNFSFLSVNKPGDLPDNTIKYIFQDNKSFIWLCTGKGLVKYDGNNFRSLQPNSKMQNLELNRITHIMQDNTGKFWISSSNNGVFIYDAELETWENYKHDEANTTSLGNDNVYKSYQDSKGRIWICTLGSGIELWLPQKKEFKHFKHSENDTTTLANNHVTSIIEDVNGNLWVASNGAYISQFNPSTGSFINYKTQFKGINLGGFFKNLYFTGPETLWITTEGTGIYQFNTQSHSFIRYCQDFKPGSLNNNVVKGMIADINGKILFITDGGGINILDLKTRQFKYIVYNKNNNNGLTTNALYSIFRDNDNNIWLGTNKSGLFLLKENTRTIKVITEGDEKSGLCYKSVLCILKDSEGLLWYGTDGGGLNCYDPGTGKYHCYQFDNKNKHSISDNVIKAIHEDNDGIIWIATFFGGLNKFDKKTRQFTRYQYNTALKNSISSNNLWCVLEDNNETMWIGNFSSGLDLFDKKTETFRFLHQDYMDSSTYSHVQVSSLIQDKTGDIWIGTLRGLNHMQYHSKKCERFYNNSNDSNSLSDDFITCMYYDSHQRLWIGTEDGGLNQMIKPGVFRKYGLSGGLPNLSIQSIEEDEQENLWISTKGGLVKFNIRNEAFYNMDDAEDLIGNEFNWNSSYKDNEGNLYFGSINGVCIFKPSEIKFNKPFPKIEFTNIKVFSKALEVGKAYHGQVLLNKSITYGGKVTLTSHENAFTIDFSAIEFNKPNKIKYKYQLIGFDKEEIITDALHRNATYTNLPGGKYSFKLSSTNSDGIWNSEYKQLEIIIIPPFYQRWWFISLLILAILILIFYIYRKNLEKHRQIMREEALKREKEFAQQRNKELKSEIASNTILLLQKNESLEQIMDKLRELDVKNESEIKIRELINLVEHQKDVDTYWHQFEFNFDNAYQHLLSRLKVKYPHLTRTNLKLCAYLRLNLSSKEIASLMNITPSGADKARNRLRKKLDIQPQDNLSDFLINF